jgi:hypothetical protein
MIKITPSLKEPFTLFNRREKLELFVVIGIISIIGLLFHLPQMSVVFI